MLQALHTESVKFILVGAYALAAHGYPRATMDIDIWIMSSGENAKALMKALILFGAPVNNITEDDLKKENIIFQIGVAPRRIDIITSVDGLNFEEAFKHSNVVEIENIPVHILSKADLIINKRASGRTKDLADAELLEEDIKEKKQSSKCKPKNY
jgi:hypothetical protein